MTMLEVQNLDIYYGKAQALHRVDLQVREGEFVSVIGPNGAGKTTLFSAISGLLPHRGSIRFRGSPLPRRPHEIVSLGIIQCPEGRNLFSHLNVLDNLNLGTYRRTDSGAEVMRDLGVVFELFPRLKEREHQLAHTLSGGEQQMVAIGRALMGRPQLLLLDEPTLGLAPIVRKAISDALQEIKKRFGMSILLAEQNAAFAFEHSQRIYLLETGRVAREGSAEQLKQDEYICKSYLGA
ncbi:ABC transporter ATP-binding protein [Candidatus Acetothermia bacterium]|nr:ABC transporter ATP-binding protein [Candidatus Acetothermia bacterium]MBI3459554.1 ABC transporter ATP-binding protein [Candidatus Acetothermia bacterium]